jgi:ATP-dependent protease ClpP protease subunit
MIILKKNLKAGSYSSFVANKETSVDVLKNSILSVEIKNAADIAVIDIDGVIGYDWWAFSEEDAEKNTLTGLRKQLEDITASKIIVNIHSGGGDASHGLAMLDALKLHPAEIETRVFGYSASAATIIAQAATQGKRFMSPNAMYLIHEVWTWGYANKTRARQLYDELEGMDKNIAALYARGGKSVEEISELMSVNNGDGKFINADTALEYGLIDGIIDLDSDEFKTKNMAQLPATTTNQNPAAVDDRGLKLKILKHK